MATFGVNNRPRIAHELSASPGASKPAWVVLLILGAAIIPYLSSLGYGFVYDDNVQVLGLPAIRSWSFVPAYFFKPIPGVFVRYYRPVFFIWLRVNYILWNTRAWGWHLSNVTLHAGVSLLVLVLLHKYFRDARCALAAALLFAVHPAHIETVAWVSGCTDSLMAIWLLGSLLLWMKNRESRTPARRFGSLLCCALALLSKETAILLPLLIGLHALVGIPAGSPAQGNSGSRLRLSLWEAAPYAGITAVYLAVRSWVLTGVAETPNWVSFAQSLLTMPSLLLSYMRHVLWPVGLSIYYDFPIVSRAGSHLFWLPLLTLTSIAAGAWLWFRRSGDARIVIAGMWMILPVAPVLYIRMFQPDDFIHDRYLYLPVLALSILAGIFCEFLWQQEPMREAFSFPAAIVGFAVITLTVATTVQAQPWKSDLSLYTHAIRIAPKNTIARNNLAREYIDEGRFQEASGVLKALLEDRPQMWQVNYNYGYVNYRLGNLTIAEDYLRRAIRIDGSDADQYIFLGTIYFKEGRLAEAAEQVRQGIARNANGFGYHFTLGMIELQQGNLAAARAEMQEELKYHPESASRVAQVQPMIEQLTKSTP